MSIYGMMRTSISGMAAQAYRLTAVSDNIANADTTGYKRSGIEFTSLVVPGANGASSSVSNYESGTVVPHTRQSISQQGTFGFTASPTDLALDGDGFFVVTDQNGTPMLTRAGSFVSDGAGNLYNSAGFYLQGYPLNNGELPNVANGFGGLENVNINSEDLVADPTTSGTFNVNLPAGAAIFTGSLPSANVAASDFTQKSSLTVFDSLGNERVIDVYTTKTATNTWEVTAYDQAGASAAGAPFPYASAALATATLSFSATDGTLNPSSANGLAFNLTGGSAITIDMSKSTQLGAGFIIADAQVNGSSPSTVDHVEVRSDGTLYAAYTNGAFKALYRIPVATVTSPDQLTAATGTAFETSAESGEIVLGFVGDGSSGRILSSALEQSNVDIAEELTRMIQAQRGYSANSKVFQTGSEVTEIAINLKR